MEIFFYSFFIFYLFNVKIRPLMDGNKISFGDTLSLVLAVKIRPLMDGNSLSVASSPLDPVKIRPLMDGNKFL